MPIIIKLKNVFAELEEHKKKKLEQLSDKSPVINYEDNLMSSVKRKRLEQGK